MDNDKASLDRQGAAQLRFFTTYQRLIVEKLAIAL
jgi:hypothetical protein